MKPRINIYLDDHTAAQLAMISKRPGGNKSRIVNDAIDRFLNPEKYDNNRALVRRLDRMSKAMDRLDRNQSVSVETLALFIRYFLTITPPLPDDDQAAAHAIGRGRFEVFVAQVGRRLATDKNLLSEVLETIADTRPDLFAVDPDQAAKRFEKHDPEGAAIAADPDEDDDLPPLRPVVIEDWDDPELADIFGDEEFEEDHDG
jgi:hypothetical protein